MLLPAARGCYHFARMTDATIVRPILSRSQRANGVACFRFWSDYVKRSAPPSHGTSKPTLLTQQSRTGLKVHQQRNISNAFYRSETRRISSDAERTCMRGQQVADANTHLPEIASTADGFRQQACHDGIHY